MTGTTLPESGRVLPAVDGKSLPLSTHCQCVALLMEVRDACRSESHLSEDLFDRIQAALNGPTAADEITDEQFREARRQITSRLRWSARSARENALIQASSIADNPQNMLDERLLLALLHRAREHANAANQVEMMEREGFDWGDGG